MPLYIYKCEDCGLEMDKVFPMNNFPREVKCIACGRTAKKILSPTAIQTDGNVPWLASACDTLQTPTAIQTDGNVPWLASACDTLQTSRERKERPITTRTEWKACLKKKGLIPIG